MRPFLVTVSLATAFGCANSGGAVASAIANTALAASVSAARRANGECYTPCNPGTRCNEQTGTCDPIPCGGACRPDETCEQTHLGERCMPTAALELLGSPTTERATRSAAPATSTAPADAGVPPPAAPSDVPRRPPDVPPGEPR